MEFPKKSEWFLDYFSKQHVKEFLKLILEEFSTKISGGISKEICKTISEDMTGRISERMSRKFPQFEEISDGIPNSCDNHKHFYLTYEGTKIVIIKMVISNIMQDIFNLWRQQYCNITIHYYSIFVRAHNCSIQDG